MDLSSFIFRAFYAIPALFNTKKEPTHAIYGVATMLMNLLEKASSLGDCLAVVWDSPEPSFRKKIFPDYKAQRQSPPEDLISQLKKINDLVEALPLFSYRLSGWEADDLIASVTKKWQQMSPDHSVVIVSSDKDFLQLLSDNPQDTQVILWDTVSEKKYTSVEVKKKWGIYPSQMIDFLALLGDQSDNVPGVSGIGEKGAAKLLSEFSSLESIFKAAEEGKISGKKKRTFTLSKISSVSFLFPHRVKKRSFC